jgi:vanillate O-demethylase monooxygenase subunit
MNADYRLLIDNLLDLSHVYFLHRGLLRNEETENAEIQVQRASDSVAVTRTRWRAASTRSWRSATG